MTSCQRSGDGSLDKIATGSSEKRTACSPKVSSEFDPFTKNNGLSADKDMTPVWQPNPFPVTDGNAPHSPGRHLMMPSLLKVLQVLDGLPRPSCREIHIRLEIIGKIRRKMQEESEQKLTETFSYWRHQLRRRSSTSHKIGRMVIFQMIIKSLSNDW